jgi:pimeloyl-ACP methyl ester carboxylesterase
MLAPAGDMIPRGWQLSARRELTALVTAAASTPWSLFLRDEAFDPTAPHPTPVVLIHGLFGSASNFLSLRRVLGARGISNVHSFSYRPGIDVSRVAQRLGTTIERSAQLPGARTWTWWAQPGNFVARYPTELPAGNPVRRLVTLGAPCTTPESSRRSWRSSPPTTPHPPTASRPRRFPGRTRSFRLRAIGSLPSRRPCHVARHPAAASTAARDRRARFRPAEVLPVRGRYGGSARHPNSRPRSHAGRNSMP